MERNIKCTRDSPEKMEQFTDSMISNFEEKKEGLKENARLAWLYFQNQDVNERFARMRNITVEELDQKTEHAYDALKAGLARLFDMLIKLATGIVVEVTDDMVLQHANFLVSQSDNLLELMRQDVAVIRGNASAEQQ